MGVCRATLKLPPCSALFPLVPALSGCGHFAQVHPLRFGYVAILTISDIANIIILAKELTHPTKCSKPLGISCNSIGVQSKSITHQQQNQGGILWQDTKSWVWSTWRVLPRELEDLMTWIFFMLSPNKPPQYGDHRQSGRQDYHQPGYGYSYQVPCPRRYLRYRF